VIRSDGLAYNVSVIRIPLSFALALSRYTGRGYESGARSVAFEVLVMFTRPVDPAAPDEPSSASAEPGQYRVNR